MRLINADALKEKAHKEFRYLEITLKDIDGLIKSAPTIEPAQGGRAADECDYCTGYKTIKSEEKHGIFEDICISGNTLIADINSGYMEAKINYCPMCGGELNEK
jgi:hypothetical protein